MIYEGKEAAQYGLGVEFSPDDDPEDIQNKLKWLMRSVLNRMEVEQEKEVPIARIRVHCTACFYPE